MAENNGELAGIINGNEGQNNGNGEGNGKKPLLIVRAFRKVKDSPATAVIGGCIGAGLTGLAWGLKAILTRNPDVDDEPVDDFEEPDTNDDSPFDDGRND